jgi:hypothetical protein
MEGLAPAGFQRPICPRTQRCHCGRARQPIGKPAKGTGSITTCDYAALAAIVNCWTALRGTAQGVKSDKRGCHASAAIEKRHFASPPLGAERVAALSPKANANSYLSSRHGNGDLSHRLDLQSPRLRVPQTAA